MYCGKKIQLLPNFVLVKGSLSDGKTFVCSEGEEVCSQGGHPTWNGQGISGDREKAGKFILNWKFFILIILIGRDCSIWLPLVMVDQTLGAIPLRVAFCKRVSWSGDLERCTVAKDFLISAVENRKKEDENRKQQEKIREEEFRREERRKEREHELELARFRTTRNDGNRSPLSSVTSNGDGDISLDKLIKGVEILTIPVPRKTESWNLFFDSLERAYKHKKVPEEFQAEILLKLLGDKASNVLVYIKEEDLKDYAKVKALILKEFEPTSQACLENFRKAKRNSGETHIQFVSRLASTWEYYCELRKVEDYECLKELIISDKLFQALDTDTASHICLKQGEKWLRPQELDQEGSKILLTPAFGGQIEAKICRVSIYYKNSGNNLFNNVDTLIAVTDKLNVPCLITPGIYELLVHSAGISHLFDDEINSERKALTLHSEAKRRETDSFYPQQPSEGSEKEENFYPQQPSEDSEKEEKSEQPIEVRRSDVIPSARKKAEISETLENADDVTSSTEVTRGAKIVSVTEGSFPAVQS
ncbi:hypothetical protein AVEN_122660-1 [Araneus ventricosus]|uniref:Uncharacterized protein n=1 Tax=Araneus ventricosus TaxID=182803 RepID=A0A4Y2FHA6_ARAVE|nr:hypothetical protein AVEN_122660-1 [Araneus ventricosus]